MTMSRKGMVISDFLRDDVYPNLDAVSAGLLDHLNPSTLNTGSRGDHYSLDCPKCGLKGRAFYYVGDCKIVCNRVESCRNKFGSTSIWDAIEKSGMARKDILKSLADAAKVTLPSQETGGERATMEIMIEILRSFLHANTDVSNRFCIARGLTGDELEKLGYGYYPSGEIVKQKLREKGGDISVAIKLGYLPDPNIKPYRDPFKGRIVGFWETSDRTPYIWGRVIDKSVPRNLPKYLFTDSAKGFNKDCPYMFRRSGSGKLYLLEGTLDADSLYLTTGCRAAAVGANHINISQAIFFLRRNIRDVVFITDSGSAAIHGAVDSIANCEAVGINVSVCALADGMDDIDQLRQDKKLQEIKNVLASELHAGEFLGRLYVSNETAIHQDARLSLRIKRVIPELSESTKLVFDTTLKRLGARYDPAVDALRMMYRLVESGIIYSSATEIVSKATGIAITVDVVHDEL